MLIHVIFAGQRTADGQKYAIGASGADGVGILPWRCPADSKNFKAVTTSGVRPAVIMGRRTWESLPEAWRPLPGRYNVVVSQSMWARDISDEIDDPSGYQLAPSLGDAYTICENAGCDVAYVCGGAAIYEEALRSDRVSRVFMTEIKMDSATSIDTFIAADALARYDFDDAAFQEDAKNKLSYRFYTGVPKTFASANA